MSTSEKWYGIHVPAPQWAVEWVDTVNQSIIREKINPSGTHITLIYGIKEGKFKDVEAYVQSQMVTIDDIKFGSIKFVQPTHTLKNNEAYIVLEVISEKLDRIRNTLEMEHLGRSSGISNHITLAKTHRIAQLDQVFGHHSFIIHFENR